jgi:signal transduction histidine kinase
VGKLAAQITHEIRNPLSSLSLNAEMLQEQIEAGSVDQTEARALVGAMAREVDRLTEVTEQYLRFARMPKPTLETVELGDAVDELVTFMGPELSKAGVEIRRAYADEAPRVRADAGQLRQVLLNLLRNAVEALDGLSGERRTITVGTRCLADQEVEVFVRDRGPGAPQETVDRMFDPFYTTKRSGTGLGLAISRTIARSHHGTLAHRPNPDGGAEFYLRLPRMECEAAT